MNKFKLNKNNNSKKLYIGVSIIFCTVILIIGGTIAFFTQSGVGDTGNIVTANINGTIGFSGGSNDYMRNNLIPVKESDVSLFAMKNTSNTSGNYTNDDICHYQDDMYACSLYQFTVKNNANVTQDMKITLTPNPNGFANLHYMMYIGEQDKLTTESKVAKTNTHIDGQNPSTMINSVVLKPQEEKTYTVVFYIKAMGYDQTGEDADKNFGAIIKVDSITTGAYKHIIVGNTCYEFEDLDDGTLKLTKFNGIDANGNIDSTCGVTKSEDGFYTVGVPSTIGNTKVSTLGNNLFTGVDITTFELNNYSRIEKIIVEEGITTIEDLQTNGTFSAIGTKVFSIDQSGNPNITAYDRFISVELPSTLSKLGMGAFIFSGVNNVIFNTDENNVSNLDTISNSVFHYSNINNIILPEGIKTISPNAFQDSKLSNIKLPSTLETIGNQAFSSTSITSLTIPNSVTSIGNQAFSSTSITSLTIPNSVTSIGDYAFDSNENLLTLIFEEGSKLTTIGYYAFNDCNLTYTDSKNPLIIPSSVTSIGNFAFSSSSTGTDDSPRNRNLKFIRFEGILLEGNPTNWYSSDNTILNPPIEE